MDTAHSQETAEAVGVPVTDVDSAAAALNSRFTAEAEATNESEVESQEAQEGETELEIEDQDDVESEQDADPAIAPPASLTAEEKARYAQLPPEAQQLLSEVETRRNAQVQTATTKAAEAQRNAESAAATAEANAKKVYAAQLMEFAKGIAPQAPDPVLATTDPAQYIALKAQYDHAAAQFGEFVQQVQGLSQEADTQLDQAFVAQRDRELSSIPEVQNEATRTQFFEKAIEAAKSLELDLGMLNGATANEWKALNRIQAAFEKEAKYDAAMSKQMQRVRDAKTGKVMKPTAAQPMGSGKQRAFAEATTRLKQSGSVDDAAAALLNILQ